MSRFEDFARGHRVAHANLGDGIVTHVNDDFVFVAFDKTVITGQYDRRWFELYPAMLFHRSAA